MKSTILIIVLFILCTACSKDDDEAKKCEENLRVVAVDNECDVVPDCDYTIVVKNTETEEITEYPVTGETTYLVYKKRLELATNGETVCWEGYVN